MFAASLICPVCRTPLSSARADSLRCQQDHSFDVCDGVPVLLRDDVPQTLHIAKASMARARGDAAIVDQRAPGLFLESLGISDEEKQMAAALAGQGGSVDPVVSVIIGATSGINYKHLIGTLDRYPIPDIRLPAGNGKILLDIGCNWGRWSVAATKKGYRVIGIDPSLGAVMAARRVAKQFDLPVEYLVADARFLPFENDSFDTVFSYSVIQHFSKADAAQVISEIGRTLKPSGTSLVQMANALGLRNFYVQARRRFHAPQNFDVRYWPVSELARTFKQAIGPTEIGIHCFFGLGLERSDMAVMSSGGKLLIRLSDWLRQLGGIVPPLRYVADSLYVFSTKPAR